jgi:Zn ribbon nucleic-acid-binding protein
MRTNRAKLAPYRMKPLHPLYVERALAHIKLLTNVYPPRTSANETTCPYCGEQDRLRAVIKIGTKEHVDAVPLTRDGYTLPPEEAGRESEIEVIDCAACGAAIEPLAYRSPGWFYANRNNLNIWDKQAV